MAFLKGGKDITALCDLSYSGDTRNKASLNTAAYWFNGGTRATKYPDAQFLTYTSGYKYSAEGLGGAYNKGGTALQVAAKGCRPGTKNRWSSSASGTYYLNRFSDGEVWISTTSNSRSGTRISTTSDNLQYVFVVLGAAGGGGGGATLTASAGGGGGGGYSYCCVKLTDGSPATIKIGVGGGRGESKENGGSGQETRITMADGFFDGAFGGGGGKGGGNDSGAGGSGGSLLACTTTVHHSVGYKTGGAGGDKNNAGTAAFANFTNYSPEAQQVTYLTGSGGASGGSSGGGGGGGSPLGNGGNAISSEAGADGMICAGGGGASYKAFNQHPGGTGGNGYCAILY
jgi:hypothetical protein